MKTRTTTVLRGPLGALALQPEFAAPTLVVTSNGEFPRPWALMRAVLCALAQRKGVSAVERAMASHRGPLSLIFRGLEPLLDDDERANRERAAAVSLGFLSHQGAQIVDLMRAFRAAVFNLIDSDIQTIGVLDALDADELSIALLRNMALAPTAAKFDLVLGEPTDLPPVASLWERSRILAATHLAQLALLPQTRVREIEASDKPLSQRTFSSVAPNLPWDDEFDLRAYARLHATTLDRDASIQVLEAMRACFRAFGFDATLRLGLDFAEANPMLESSELAEMHTLIGLSAYNRQVRTEGNAELADLLGKHFAAALSHETDPLHRSHLLYRQTINEGRRKGQLAKSLDIANAAIAVLKDVPAELDDLKAFVEAWARNGRAYVYARMRRMDEAIADCNLAFDLAMKVKGSPLLPFHESQTTPIVLADNMAELWLRAGNLERAREWQQKFAELEHEQRNPHILSFRRLREIEERAGRLDAAQAAAEGLVIASRNETSIVDEDLYTSELGELLYRRGDARGAIKCFQDVLAIRRRVASAEDVRASLVALALAKLRAHDVVGADEHFAEALALTSEADTGLRAQFEAYRGLCAALMANADSADEHINVAVDLAVASGERDALLRVARLAGETCVVLDRKDSAIEAFSQALEVAGDDQDETAPPASEMVLVHLGLATLRQSAEHVQAALSLCPVALENAETWRILPTLLELSAMAESLNEAATRGLEAAKRASIQRVGVS